MHSLFLSFFLSLFTHTTPHHSVPSGTHIDTHTHTHTHKYHIRRIALSSSLVPQNKTKNNHRIHESRVLTSLCSCTFLLSNSEPLECSEISKTSREHTEGRGCDTVMIVMGDKTRRRLLCLWDFSFAHVNEIIVSNKLERFKVIGKFNGKKRGTKKTHTNLIDFCADTMLFP